EPVVVEADVRGVAVLDVLPGGGVGGAEEVLRLGVAGDLQRPEPERGAGVPREYTHPTGNEPRQNDQPQAWVCHAAWSGTGACAARERIVIAPAGRSRDLAAGMVSPGRMVRSGESRRTALRERRPKVLARRVHDQLVPSRHARQG